jgi:hypothetical protein
MGIGYKTAWLATRDAPPQQVADALGLGEQRAMDWTTGTEAAYRRGVFVARPVAEWTIAHGRIDLPPRVDATDPRFLGWLEAVGAALGDFQYFVTDRIGEYHGWARFESGTLTRAYCFIGQNGDVPLHLGEPTPIERELGVGHRWLEDGWQEWDESAWDAWNAAMPRESHVMRVAENWSICPLDIAEDAAVGPGIYGLPPEVPQGIGPS